MPGVIFSADSFVLALPEDLYAIRKSSGGGPIILNADSNSIQIPPNVTYAFTLQVIMRSQDGTQHAFISRQGMVVSDDQNNVIGYGLYEFGIDNNIPGYALSIELLPGTLNVIVSEEAVWLGRIDGIQVASQGS